jgi:hypothetical protein
MPAKKHTMTEEERSRRFVETARQLECDESGEAFERALEKILPTKQAHPKSVTKAGGKPKPP